MKKEPHPQEIRFILARLLKIGKMAIADGWPCISPESS
jgi:hypothetical protein